MQVIKSTMPSERFVLIVGWKHSFFAVEKMVSAAALALAEFGYAVLIADSNQEDDALIAFQNIEKFDFVIFVGALSLNFTYDNKAFFSLIKAPKYYWLLDPIFYDLMRVPRAQEYFKYAQQFSDFQFLVPDRFSEILINSAINESTKYFPFGGFPSPINYSAQRKDAIAVFGTIGAELGDGGSIQSLEDALGSFPSISFDQKSISLFVASLTSNNAKNNTASVLSNLCNFEPHVFFSPIILTWICKVDSYLKRSRRINIVKALTDFPVNFYGSGWDSLIENNHKWINHGEFANPDMSQEMQKYTSVLNFDPNWDDGLHDRVYTALVSGVRVITNENQEISEDWLINNDILTYNAHNCEFNGDIEQFIQQSAMPIERILKYQNTFSWFNRISEFLVYHKMRF